MPLDNGCWTFDEWAMKGYPKGEPPSPPEKECDHVWETIDPFISLCFECNDVRKFMVSGFCVRCGEDGPLTKVDCLGCGKKRPICRTCIHLISACSDECREQHRKNLSAILKRGISGMTY